MARVVGTSGVHGEVKLELLGPEDLLSPGRYVLARGARYQIGMLRRTGRTNSLKLVGVDSRKKAEALRGVFLEMRAEDLPPLPQGEYYWFQLIGLAVQGTDGRALGRIKDVLSKPGNDVYVVEGSFGEVLVPAVDEVVQGIDLAARVMTIEIVPGLLP